MDVFWKLLFIIIFIHSFIHCLQSYEQDEDDQYNAGYDVGSFPKDFGYGPFDQDGDGPPGPLVSEQKPRILLMGLRRWVKKLPFKLL